MEIVNMEKFLIAITFVFLVCLVLFITHMYDMKSIKEAEDRSIKARHDHVLRAYQKIENLSTLYGDEFYESLMSFADKMDKLKDASIGAKLKPYDSFAKAYLNGSKISSCNKLCGRIVIDKNLIPRFIVDKEFLLDKKFFDTELEVSYTSNNVRILAEKCKIIKNDADLEEKRCETIENIING